MADLNRRDLAKGLALGALSVTVGSAATLVSPQSAAVELPSTVQGKVLRWEPAGFGIWTSTIGSPEEFTPVAMRRHPVAAAQLNMLPAVGQAPREELQAKVTPRGVQLTFPLVAGERIYGLGLQMYSVEQRGKKKLLRVNADPCADTGDAHAPVPFFVSTRGYGVLIDTARHVTFYCGDAEPKSQISEAADRQAGAGPEHPPEWRQPGSMEVEVSRSQGVNVYLFAGPEMRQAVQRYNLFSGGGCAPPEWGLGFWYRVSKDATADDVLALAKEFRARRIPCDVIGLEPGWQSHAYSCTFVWDQTRFPDPTGFVSRMGAMDLKVNLWEHAFTNPRSPIFEDLRPYSGDYSVWNGLVPDFAAAKGREIFGEYHRKTFIDIAISGFKLDECDNSDYTGGWSFPDLSSFPSGLDGEQMHAVFGLRYQDAILEQFRAAVKPTYGLVRSSGALAAPYPFVLYSDLYDHRVYIRALVNSGFSGLLWCPEVRDAKSPEDLIRRLQSVVFSPLAMINGWYIKNPPWKQQDREKNNADEFNPGWQELEARCRKLIELRMQLVPYLRAAFAQYSESGLPPVRALALDYPEDSGVAEVDDQFLVGDRMLVAPFFAGEESRKVIFPAGAWCDFWTGKPIAGRQTMTVAAEPDAIPVYVKSGSVMAMGGIGSSTNDPESRHIEVRIYGDGSLPFRIGSGQHAILDLAWNHISKTGSVRQTGAGDRHYEVVRWQEVG